MWSYYGAKTTVIKFYPPPKYDRIIEPFAGTARYALKYFDREVIIMDKYPVIVKIWKWLQKCSEKDILSLPRFKVGQNINEHTYSCEEERMLVGFLIGFGFMHPRKIATPRLRDRPNTMNFKIKSIASNLFKIRHWDIKEGSYESIRNQRATWFVDPPYSDGGHVYVHSSKDIDYKHLATWCQNREGQLIVCGKSTETWLPFQPLTTQACFSGVQKEGIWTNTPIESTKYRAQKMFE